MSWHQLTHKKTGEQQVVASLDGYDLKDWNEVKLDRKPGEHDDIVDGKVVRNKERAALTERRAALSGNVLVDLVIQLEQRVADLERTKQ